MAKEFHDPHVALGKVYTRTGDQGETSLVGGQRLPKDDLRIEAYGTIDELNAVLGLVRGEAIAAGEPLQELPPVLLQVQHQLFNLGSALATLPEDMHPRQPRVTAAHIQCLEDEIDKAGAGLKGLTSFLLPGADRLDGIWHLARTVCRRAERRLVALQRQGGCDPLAVQYVNRLSDACFAWGRWCLHRRGVAPVLWDPNQG